MKKALLIMAVSMGVLSSCVEERNRFVVAHRVDSDDTTTLQIIRVDKTFEVGDVVIPNGLKFKYKIVRIVRKN
jgi:hypothetical protein